MSPRHCQDTRLSPGYGVRRPWWLSALGAHTLHVRDLRSSRWTELLQLTKWKSWLCATKPATTKRPPSTTSAVQPLMQGGVAPPRVGRTLHRLPPLTLPALKTATVSGSKYLISVSL